MEVIACGELRDLIEKGEGIALHNPMQCRAACDRFAKGAHRHAESFAVHLYVHRSGPGVVAEQDRRSDHALVADGADLSRLAITHVSHHRGDARRMKVY